MAAELEAVTFDAANAGLVAAFWGVLLGRAATPEPGGVLLLGDDAQVALRFSRSDSVKTGQNPVHLHLTSASLEDQQAIVGQALEWGGRHVDVGQLPDDPHIVLADPGNNEFCVIEPGNGFLAGCGLLAEVSLDGPREVGIFWRDALGWPLVWDRDGETAIQSPHGGTKLAWGGEEPRPHPERDRQRFDLVTDDVLAESARLVALGARELGSQDDGLDFADPAGNIFTLRSR